MSHPVLFLTSLFMWAAHAAAILLYGGPCHLQFFYMLGPCTSIWNHGSDNASAKWLDRVSMLAGFIVDAHWLCQHLGDDAGMLQVMWLWSSVFLYLCAKFSTNWSTAGKLKWDDIDWTATLLHACAHLAVTSYHWSVLSRYFMPLHSQALVTGMLPLVMWGLDTALARFLWFAFNAVVWMLVIGIPALASCAVISFARDHVETLLWMCARTYFRLLLWACNVAVHVHGVDNLDMDKHYIFACNHSSLFDIPLAFHAIPHFLITVSKASVADIPIFGWLVKLGGSIFVRRSDPKRSREAMDRGAARLLMRPASVLIFPEGRRTDDPAGGVAKIQKGVVHLARKAKMQVVPMFIRGSTGIAGRGIERPISRYCEVSVTSGAP